MSAAGLWLRIAGWSALITLVGTIGFLGSRPPKDYFYEYESAANGAINYAILLGLTLLIAVRLPKRPTFALRRPSSWRVAGGLALALLVAMFVLGGVLSALVGNPGEEQGLAPTYWDGGRALAFALNLAVVSIAAPVVEELLFRGVGVSLLERFGRVAAIVGVGIAFGIWHGLLIALPLLIVFGAGLAYMRIRTGSIYPPMLLHGVFNTISVTVAVTTGG